MMEEFNCCFFAVSKMYVCYTNESCPALRNRYGNIAQALQPGKDLKHE